jgi:hypothetical protein
MLHDLAYHAYTYEEARYQISDGVQYSAMPRAR